MDAPFDSQPAAAPSSAGPELARARAELVELIARWGTPADDAAVPHERRPASLTDIPAESAVTWGFDWPRVPAPTPSAVLLLFGPLDDVPARRRTRDVDALLDVLLTQRAQTLRRHAGQVAFPGGRCDPGDGSVVATALREAREETGLDPAAVEVLGVLPPVCVAVSGYVVHPVVGWWRRSSRVDVVDHNEASAVFRVPVADLTDPDGRFMVARPGGRRGLTPGFAVQDRFVWGVTAALLSRVLELLGWDEPWDASRVVDAATRQTVR